MSEIPDDIIQAGRIEAEFYAKWLHAGNSKGSLSPHAIDGLADSFSRLIFSERQRHAEVMEEVRKVLGPFAREAANWWPAASDERFISGETAIRLSHLRAARALLSRLEER
ncbi:hypothetical protein [Rhizobium sp. 11515TR]|uniref:hypothetical protein n=1 Tax=Rhizobium sp. 11515TR TaxID=2028343 RepID=UPI000BA8A2DC|nr:hypothetical protein [Rhizobium sp. 11515TR]ASW06250.1 hypothetical protein CKA34_10390 [Rhizobium sp. 11515TR]